MRRAPDPQTAVDLSAETWAVAFQRRRSFRGSDGEHAEAVRLRVVEELSYDELAGRLGISQANARAP